MGTTDDADTEGPTLDICDVGRVGECAEKGHDPLDMDPNGDGGVPGVSMVHVKSGVEFAHTFFCKRCGLLYWGPKLTEADDG